MSNRFTIDGLDAMREQLRQLPRAMTAEAAGILEQNAQGAAGEIRGIYDEHIAGGTLASRVTVSKGSSGQFGATRVVRSADPIAYVFDYGSEERHYTSKAGTSHGTGKMWGKSRPLFAFIRTMSKWREKTWNDLAGLLEQAGFDVKRT